MIAVHGPTDGAQGTVAGGTAGLPCPPGMSLPLPRPVVHAPLGPVPALLITPAARGRGQRLSPALSVGSVMLDDTAETRAVLRPRSALGGREFISGTVSLLIRRQVLLLLDPGAG